MPLVKWKENGYLKKQSVKYANMLAVFAIAAAIVYFLWVMRLPANKTLLVLPAFVVIYVVVTKYLWTTGKRFDRGLDAEFVVTKELCKLPHAYFGFHDIEVPGLYGNIDFVVVTPAHVFALEVKDTRSFSFDNHVKQAKRNALFLSRWLKQEIRKDLFVEPVVVYTNPKNRFFNTVMPKKDGAYVVKLEMLNTMLTRPSDRGYGASDQREIAKALKRFTDVHDVICD